MKKITLSLIFIALCTSSFAQLINSFTVRKTLTQKGGIVYVSNVAVTCDATTGTGHTTCNAAKAQGVGGTGTDNNYVQQYVDIDGDPTTYMSSSDSLSLPTCSQISWAGLYWGGSYKSTTVHFGAFNSIKIKANSGAYTNVTALSSYTNSIGFTTYHNFADVTSIVQAAGINARFTLANMPIDTTGGSNEFGGWTIVVVYKNDLKPMRNLTVFEGLADVTNTAGNNVVDIPISGFLSPLSGPVTFELGLVVYDGDRSSVGDTLQFKSAGSFVSISDALHPINDVFNSTIAYNGVLTPYRNPSLNNTLGYDASIFIPNNTTKNYIGNSATSATIRQKTGGETYLTQVVTSAIDVYEPDLRAGVAVKDLNGGLVQPGDTLQYTIVGKNIGSDPSVNTYILDTLERNAIYVPGSLVITAGENTGAKTDVSGDDQAEYTAASHSLKIRIGTGANGSTGGTVLNSPSGIDSTQITFKVTATTDCIYLLCDNVIDARAYIIGTGNVSGNTFSNGSNPGIFDVNGCPIPGTTSTPINAATCTSPTASSNSPACVGSAINFNATASSSATYAWSGPNTFTSSVQNPSIASATNAMSGTYTVNITISGLSCSFHPTTSVTVNATPTVSISGTSTVCPSQTTTLTASGASTYSWSTGATTATIITPTISATTNFTVTGTTSGCPKSTVISVVVNNCPTAVGDGTTTPQNTAVVSNASTNDVNAAGGTYSAGTASSGTLTINSSTGQYTYTPTSTFVGVATATYTLCNGSPVVCSSAVITVTVTGTTPLANTDGITTPQGTVTTGNLATNDAGAAAISSPTITVTQPSASTGTITVNASTGQYTFTPNPSYVGTGSTTYTLCNNTGSCSSTTITYTVTGTTPIANSNTLTTTQGVATSGNVATNDVGAAAINSPTITVTQPSASTGTITINASTGQYTFTPNASYVGTGLTTYTLCNNTGSCSSTTITYTVTGTTPIANSNTLTTTQGVATSGNVATNDVGAAAINSPTITVTQPSASTGTITVNASTGQYTFTPNPSYVGTGSTTYTLCNNTGSCSSTTITYTVTGTPPVAVTDGISTPQGTVTTGNLATNDVGAAAINSPTITVTQPSASTGTITVNASTGQYTFTPNPSYVGTGSTTYTLCNNTGSCSSTTISYTVTGTTPVANTDSINTSQGTVTIGNLATNDIGAAALSSPTITVTQPSASTGTIIVNASTGQYTYTPNPNYVGTGSTTYTLCNNTGSCSSTTITYTVTPVNHPPTTSNINITAASGTSVPVNIAAGSSDPDGNPLTYSYGTATGIPATVTITGNGAIVVTPTNSTDTGYVYVPVTVCDNGTPALCATSTVTIHYVPSASITATNLPPSATPDHATTSLNTAVTIPVTSNDNDPNGNNTLVNPTITTPPSHGTAVVNADGTITYTPTTGYIGNDTITYQVCDNGTPALCSSAIAVVTVANGTITNHAPVAADDYSTLNENTSTTIPVKGNDSDPDGNVLGTPTIIDNANHGTAVVNGNGTITYTPNTNYTGYDTLTYVVCDNGTPSLCDTANVMITVAPVNQPPVTSNINLTAAAGAQVPVNIAAGSSDPNGDPLTYTYGTVTGISATVTITGNGSIVVTPTNPTDTGYVNVPFTVCDNGTPNLCTTGTVTVHYVPDSVVVATNFPPTATNDHATTSLNTSVNIPVKSNDSDPNGNNTIGIPTITTNPNNGTAVVNINGTITYTPTTGFVGNDTLTYQICDNGTPALCSSAIVIVTVVNGTVTNHPPAAADDYANTTTGIKVNIPVKGNDSDPDGNLLGNPTIIISPSHGIAAVKPNGTITYSPTVNYSGYDTLTYVICDNGTPSLCDTANVIIAVHPSIISETITATAGYPSVGTLASNDAGTGLTYGTTPVSGPSHGTITVGANGSYTYTPTTGYTGPDQVVTNVCDASIPPLCSTDTLFITVNSGPTVHNDNGTGTTGLPITGNVITNDSPTGLTAGPIVHQGSHGTVVVNPNGTYTYTPTNPNYSGYDTTIISVCLGSACVNDTLFIAAHPSIISETITATAGYPSVGTLASNDAGTGLTYGTTPVSGPSHGIITVGANGSYTYTPTAGYTGTDQVVTTVCDASIPPMCSNDTLFITVGAGPTVHNDNGTGTTGSPITGNVITNDSPTGLTAGPIVHQGTHGTVVVNPNGTYTYTPTNPNYSGYDTTIISVCLGSACVNDTLFIAAHPSIISETITATAGYPSVGTLASNDAGTGLTYGTTPVSGPSHGTITVGANGSYTYTPTTGYTGPDQVVTNVCDASIPPLCSTDTLFITVNSGPTVHNDNGTGTTGLPITGNVITNDSPTGLTAGPIVHQGSHGTVVVNPNGTYTYTPTNPNYSGYDTTIISVCLGSACVNDTLFIAVHPSIISETITATAGYPSVGTLASNDAGTGLTYGTTPVSGPSHGIITVGANGSYTYTPTAGYTGTDQVVTTVCDASIPPMCSNDTLFITVGAGPTVHNDNGTGTTGSPITGNVITNDSPTGLTAGPIVHQGTHGTVVVNPNGTYTYTPTNPNYSGYDTTIISVCLGSACVNDTLFITIKPTLNPDNGTGTNGNPISGNVLGNDHGSGLTVSINPVVTPAHGSVIINSNGTYTYTPSTNYCGLDSFQYQVCDNSTPPLCGTTWVYLNNECSTTTTTLIFPQGFSPNGDGINDAFVIDNISLYPDNKMQIFNRWGSLVFTGDHYDNSSVVWKGECNGDLKIGSGPVPEGTYFYIFEYKDAKGDTQKKSSYIYVSRNGN